MRYPLFQKQGLGETPPTEFAATVAALPPGADAVYATSDLSDSMPMDSGLYDARPSVPPELGADSLPAPVDKTVHDRPTLALVGRYALKSLLGSGGLGQVHEAWDPLLSRAVAVKTLQLGQDEATRHALDALFLNEARAAANLSHPHIVTVFDAGVSPHGVYIAMERLRGRDLRQALAQGWQPTPWQAAQLTRRVADALSFAHSKGVVHCDVKPANIYLDKRERPKLLDFGIARVAHRSSSTGLEGLVMGSPHYLAPEQLQSQGVDARTDVYALGVVMYEMLTGRKAFGGDSLEQITTAVLSNHPALAHELRSGVPKKLAQIAAKAMSRDPNERFAGAAELAGALRRWGERHSSTTVTTEERPVAAPATQVLPSTPVAKAAAGAKAVSGQTPAAARAAIDSVATPTAQNGGAKRARAFSARGVWLVGGALLLIVLGAAWLALGAQRWRA